MKEHYKEENIEERKDGEQKRGTWRNGLQAACASSRGMNYRNELYIPCQAFLSHPNASPPPPLNSSIHPQRTSD